MGPVKVRVVMAGRHMTLDVFGGNRGDVCPAPPQSHVKDQHIPLLSKASNFVE